MNGCGKYYTINSTEVTLDEVALSKLDHDYNATTIYATESEIGRTCDKCSICGDEINPSYIYGVFYYYNNELIKSINNIKSGDAYTVESLTANNKVITAWANSSTTPDVAYNANDNITPTANIKLYAIRLTVTYLDYDNTIIDTVTVDYGDYITLPTYTFTADYQYESYQWTDGETIYDSSSNIQIINNRTFKINLVYRNYTIDTYYIDKDGARYSDSPMDSASGILGTYNTSFDIKRQIITKETYTYRTGKGTADSPYEYSNFDYYFFYMSPVDSFDQTYWNQLISSPSKDANGNFIFKDADNNVIAMANIDSSETIYKMSLIVLCVQPAAIMIEDTSIEDSSIDITPTTNYTGGIFYKDVNSAMLQFSNYSTDSKTQYLRIYGQTPVLSASKVDGDGDGVNEWTSYSANTLTANKNFAARDWKLSDSIIFKIPTYTFNFNNTYSLSEESEYTIGAKDVLLMPYHKTCNDADGYEIESSSSTDKGSSIQGAMNIAENVTLNVNGKLIVGSAIRSAGSLYGKSVIMNNGNINGLNGSSIYAYGYIKGKGTIELEKGSNLYDVFTLYDYPGGSYALGMFNKNVFPVQCYSMHNASCEVIINYGSLYYARAQIFAADTWCTSKDMVLLGQGGLFELTSEGSYIIKTVKDSLTDSKVNTSYTTTNQSIEHKEVIEIHGDFKDNTISLKINVFGDIDMSTSAEIAMPIGFTEIVLAEGTTGTLSSSSYKFLPGSSLHICEGATLTINEGLDVVFFDDYPDDYTYINGDTSGIASWSYGKKHSKWYAQKDELENFGAQLIVDGTLISNGYIGGIAKSNGSGKIILRDNSTTIKLLNTLKYSRFGSSATTKDSTVLFMAHPNGTQFESNSTYMYINDYWLKIGDSTIIFDTQGGSEISSIKITISYSNGIINSTLSQYGDLNTKFIPTKQGYTFAGWYFDTTYNMPLEADKVAQNCTLYAKWEGNEYEIVYHNVELEEMPDSYPATHKYGNTTILPNPTRDGYKFGGWFESEDYSGEIILNIPANGYDKQIHLYARWKSEAYKMYKIHYLDQIDTSYTVEKILDDDNGTGIALGNLPDRSSIPTNVTFKGWFDSSNKEYSASSVITDNLTLTAKYECTITYYDNNNAVFTTQTYNYGDTTAAPENHPTKEGYEFEYWMDSNENEFDFGEKIYKNINLTAKWKSSSSSSCFASGTILTLADGTTKKIEDLTESDVLLVFDHETGTYTSAPILFIEFDGIKEYLLINLEFSNGTTSRIIYEHGFFDLTLNKYVYVTESNYQDFIGHEFAVLNNKQSGYEKVTLVNSYTTYEETGCYSLVTAYHMNYFIDGLFSMPGGIDGLFNYFEYDSTLKYDEEQMNKDIETYGLYTYDDFKDYIPYEIFEYMFPAKYFKVAVGKGMITFEEIVGLIERYLVGHGIV